MENKRLFFGFEIACPWPEDLPKGRVLAEADRHLTVAFLGVQNAPSLLSDLANFAGVPFPVGLCGVFDHPLFLPHAAPRTAGWRIHWLEGKEAFCQFQQGLAAHGVKAQKGEFLPHVTIARKPFEIREWKEAFQKRPLFIGNFHLYESLGSSRYRPCWSFPILAPFEEKEHTADIAFTVRGSSFQNLFLHAETALSFHFPPLIDYFSSDTVDSLDKIVQALNAIIGKADQEIGCPFKAVSYHGKVKEEKGLLEWEMIVDV